MRTEANSEDKNIETFFNVVRSLTRFYEHVPGDKSQIAKYSQIKQSQTKLSNGSRQNSLEQKNRNNCKYNLHTINKHNRLTSGELLSNDRLASSAAGHGLVTSGHYLFIPFLKTKVKWVRQKIGKVKNCIKDKQD